MNLAIAPLVRDGFIRLDRISVLVVDDSSSTRILLTEVLRGLGVRRVHQVATREAALQVLKSSTIDVILLDIVLEDDDGLEFARQIRASTLGSLASTPILVVSSHATAPRVIEAGAAGANGFLSKPFTVGVLAKRLADALSATGRRQPPQVANRPTPQMAHEIEI